MAVFVVLNGFEFFLLLMHENYAIVFGLEVALGVCLAGCTETEEKGVMRCFEFAYTVDHARLVIVVGDA
jgi:hypothetical protein